MALEPLTRTSVNKTSLDGMRADDIHSTEMNHAMLINRLSKSVLQRRYVKRTARGLQQRNSGTKSTPQQSVGTPANTSSSVNYLVTHSVSFVQWLGEQSGGFYSRFQVDRWVLLIVLGIVVGLIAALLKQSITAFSYLQWRYTNANLQDGYLVTGFWLCAGVNCSYILFSAILTTFIYPPAAGGGTIEILAFLNGIVVHKVLTMKNLIVKFVATMFANASILPTSTQAPIIVLGAIVGSWIGQFQLKLIGFSPKRFRRYRNACTRRDFTTSGVAAGVAAGFNAPIGGLMFALEDVSSFWTKSLTWFVFTSCVVAVIVTGLFNAAFSGFLPMASFGLLVGPKFKQIQMHFCTVVTAVVLGLFGGVLGALFVRFNVVVNDRRKRLLSRIKVINVRKVALILEMLLIVMLMTVYSVFMPYGFGCTTVDNSASSDSAIQQQGDSWYYRNIELIATGTCLKSADNDSQTQYNAMSTLIQGSGSDYLTKLWSRETYYLFEWYVCLASFSVYFLLTIWTLSTSLAVGILQPMLVSGSLYGRALGVGMLHAWNSITGTPTPNGTDWQWIDPGVMAGIGAASLFGGCNRMAVASAILVAEMVGDMSLIVPNMVAAFVAKSIADLLSKPLFEYQLRAKSLPYLDQEPSFCIAGKLVDLELCHAVDFMNRSVSTIRIRETIGKLAQLLLSTNHSAFPVVEVDEIDEQKEIFYGLVTRTELYIILGSDDVSKQTTPGSTVRPSIPYEELTVDYVNDIETIEVQLREYLQSTVHGSIVIDLEPFINTSTPKIDHGHSLRRTYMIFRTLGLAHLVVVNEHNHVVGMIERADLLPSRIHTRLEHLLRVPTAAEYNVFDLTTIGRHQCGSSDDEEVEPRQRDDNVDSDVTNDGAV